jgi:hypothetical protein
MKNLRAIKLLMPEFCRQPAGLQAASCPPGKICKKKLNPAHIANSSL